MASGRFDIQTGVDRLMLYPGRGHLLGIPTNSASSNSSTGVPTNSVAGFAKGALFINFKGSVGTLLYVNTGSNTSTTWLNVC